MSSDDNMAPIYETGALLGKEIMVFTERLEIQLNYLFKLRYPAKFGGATGNFNAHLAAYPEIDWALDARWSAGKGKLNGSPETPSAAVGVT